jgi:hypothetical protein
MDDEQHFLIKMWWNYDTMTYFDDDEFGVAALPGDGQ